MQWSDELLSSIGFHPTSESVIISFVAERLQTSARVLGCGGVLWSRDARVKAFERWFEDAVIALPSNCQKLSGRAVSRSGQFCKNAGVIMLTTHHNWLLIGCVYVT
uniref:Uncharacterized protein n=1 Tax=Physcomitrium patens TaxID=3218 RepID=A0A2K1KCQ5_PHYPA|nr:hypothetical protein PHYPA_010753 [Physcomitrium patens]